MVAKKIGEFLKSILFVVLGLVIVGGGWFGYDLWHKGKIQSWWVEIWGDRKQEVATLNLEVKDRKPSLTELGDVYTGSDFKIRVPKGWRVDKSGSVGEGIYFFGPVVKTSTLEYETNIGVRSVSLGEDKENYVERYLEKMKESLTGWTIVSRENLDEGVLVEASFVAGRDLFRTIFLIRSEGDKVWVVNGISLKVGYEEVRSLLKSSLLSLVTW